MIQYRYEAIDSSGKRIKSTIKAETKEEAIQKIRETRCRIVSIKEDNSIVLFEKKKCKKRDLSLLFVQFSTMLEAGISIVEAIKILSVEAENTAIKTALEKTYNNLQKGQTLAESMEGNPEVFPRLVISMVKVGEVTGNIEQMLKHVALNLEKDAKIEGKVKSAMAYPMTVGVVGGTVMIGMLIWVIPQFASIFADSDVPLPGITKAVLNSSEFVQKNFIWLFLAAIMAGVMFSKLLKTDKGRFMMAKIALKLPIRRDLEMKVVVSRLCRTFSLLNNSGLEINESLDIIQGVLGNVIIENKIADVNKRIFTGENIAVAMNSVKTFPHMLISMVEIGEKSGNLGSVLEKLSDFYETEVEFAIERFLSLIEPLMILVLAVGVGIMLMSVYLPMFDMAQIAG